MHPARRMHRRFIADGDRGLSLIARAILCAAEKFGARPAKAALFPRRSEMAGEIEKINEIFRIHDEKKKINDEEKQAKEEYYFVEFYMRNHVYDYDEMIRKEPQ